MLGRALVALSLTVGLAAAMELDLPTACTPGDDCLIQQYVDRDSGPDLSDYTCGGQTSDGHDSTDFRLRDLKEVEKGVAVLAAAIGVVVGIRDGVTDRLMRSEEDRAAVGEQECGNGVRIDHGDGWSMQYCHMRNGPVAVKEGDKVEAGTKLGEVSYSGAAAFPQMHLSQRRLRR
ncbi:MAG: M23 family metallopeptidase [Methyloceanibacter sp.]